MRRLLRKRTQHPSLALALPHEDSHVAPADQVLGSIRPDELGLRDMQPIWGDVLLIKLPNPDQLEHWPLDELKLLLDEAYKIVNSLKDKTNLVPISRVINNIQAFINS